MLKSISLFVSTVVLFIAALAGFSSDKPVTVRQEIPAQAQTGHGIQITFHIERNDHEGFAKLQQAIPKGYGAEAITTGSAQFIRTEEEVKFIWTQLPQDESFDVAYRLIPKTGVEGYLKLDGVLSYVNDKNKTEKVWVNPAEVRIGQRMTTRIENNGPVIRRRMIALQPEEGEFRIELTMQPGGLKEAARFVDRVPTGFTATAAETNGAAFAQNGRNVAFDWKQFPDDQEFTIAYTIRCGGVTTTPIVEGVLLYGDELVVADEKPEVEQLPGASIASPAVASNSNNIPAVSNASTPAPSKMQIGSMSSTAGASTAATGKPATSRKSKPTTSTVSSTPNTPYVSTDGVHFKVQILATRHSTARSGNWMKTYYHLTENVELYEQNGWKKYVTGHYPDYQVATDARSTINQYAKDAFVVAYRSGERIPVGEAIRWSRTGH